jgi:FKBP-type peptidyl-prolyl cis-trans isomerase 2
MKIAKGSIVRIEYELRVKGGDVLESSSKRGPLQYTHGDGALLPALEKRLEGLEAGASLAGEIPAAEAIPEDTLPTKVLGRAEIAKAGPVEVGAMFEAQMPPAGTVNLRIVKIDGDNVTVRVLPPLAGKDLAFKVKVVRIEDPKTHQVAAVRKPPPPLPAEALHLELEPEEE